MSEEKFEARNSFREDGRCIVTGYKCEPKADCRMCNVPLAINTIKIVEAIEHMGCDCNDTETTETTE